MSDWKVWKGGDCPFKDKSTEVMVAFRSGKMCDVSAQAGRLRWDHTGSDGDITAYRLCGVNDAGENTSVSIDSTLNERGNRYGTFKKHAKLSQALFRLIHTHHNTNDGKGFSDVQQEALQMICHKLARIANGDPDYDDSWRDIAGYAELVVKDLNGEEV